MNSTRSRSGFQQAALGVVENMSFYTDSNGVRINLFGEGGGKRLASDMKVRFLGDIPIDSSIGVAGDQGQSYQGICAQSYETIAGKLL